MPSRKATATAPKRAGSFSPRRSRMPRAIVETRDVTACIDAAEGAVGSVDVVAFPPGTVTETARMSTSSPAVTVAVNACRPGFDRHGAGSA